MQKEIRALTGPYFNQVLLFFIIRALKYPYLQVFIKNISDFKQIATSQCPNNCNRVEFKQIRSSQFHKKIETQDELFTEQESSAGNSPPEVLFLTEHLALSTFASF